MKSLILKNLSLYCIAIALLSACNDSSELVDDEPIIRPVRTMIVEKSGHGAVSEFPAIVDAANTADLSFKVSGEVIKLAVKQGERVSKGDLIALLDDTNYKLAFDEATASYEKADADFKRAKQLIKTNTISQADYDKLKAQSIAAESQLTNAKNNLRYTKLYASFDGILARSYIEQYEEVQAKQPIVTLQNIQRIHLKINVPERMIVSVSKDEVAKLVYAKFSAIPHEEFHVDFVEISTKADEATKTYEVTLGMDTLPNHTILPGMIAQVLVKHKQDPQMIFLPIKTVLKDGSGHFVWTVKNSGNGLGTIIKTPITIGKISDLGFTVLSGLTEGEQVVTAGMSKISSGQTVRLSETN